MKTKTLVVGAALSTLHLFQLAVAQEASTSATESSLDPTVVSGSPAAAPTPVRSTSPTQTVRQATVSRPVEVEVYDTIEPEVIEGGAEATFELPGSGFFITSQDIRDQNYVNVNRVLAKVPGVYVREEDGFGNFPNISIRGVDGTRSEKVTIMEDGILQAPAPYSAPSAYYSPNIARMAGVEILKGSSQVAYGPHTTGGVINFLSTPIPDSEQLYFRGTYGSNGNFQLHGHYGNIVETAIGRVGFLAELYYKGSDGFRTIDGSTLAGVAASDRSGFGLIEPTIKVRWEPNTALDQSFEFKWGMTDLDADETYLGLTEGDLFATPYRRYFGSFLDNISTEQHRTYLKWNAALNDDLDVQIAAYYNSFERDWFKIRRVNGSSLHTTLLGNNAGNLATLQGLAPGTLGYRHNARSYYSQGIQGSTEYRFNIGSIENTLDFGVREHRDQIRRFQENTDIVFGNGTYRVVDRGPGSGGNRVQEVESTAVWLQDTIEIGSLTISPGARYEHSELHNTDFANDATNTPTAMRTGSIDWWTAG
ncbi:MAG: TonB-dependent receptor plug domain-containing protein, partial [Verrucomicrobiota bacterium]